MSPTLCALCGDEGFPVTNRCDRCWELETRIEADPPLAARILARIQKKEPRP